jgi:hypothetical protein
MQFGKAVGWIGITSVLFATIGAAVGYLLGQSMPGYYRSVFDARSDPDFDPIAVGFGQGLTQGMVLGAAVGLVLVLSYWWKEAKLATLAVQMGDGNIRENLQPSPTALERSEDLSVRQ